MRYSFLLSMIGALFCSTLMQCKSQVKESQQMDFEKYEPTSTLVVPQHPLHKAKFPFIDVHNHQWGMASQSLAPLVKDMDLLNLRVMVNLSGENGAELQKMVRNVQTNYPKRFIIFANIDFDGIDKEGWINKTVHQLELDVQHGANGLKIYKTLGMEAKDSKGNYIAVDDTRLDAIWEKCAALKIPVLIHTADPKPFWDAPDEHNERWLELKTHPDRKRNEHDPAPWQTLINQQHAIFRKHPNTHFIAAHFGWYANDLDHLGKLLDSLPNVYVEFGAVIAELGRQPRRAKQFFTQYQDRILFGKDSWVPAEYDTYFRVLETEDEYFPYHKKYHAFWRMYGLGLPDTILKKVYYKNALALIPTIDKSAFPD